MTIIIEEIKTRIIHTLKSYYVARAAIFSYFARGNANEISDLDILVEFKGEKSLLNLIGLKLEIGNPLEKLLICSLTLQYTLPFANEFKKNG